jgi:hypothetical protein
MPLLLPERLFYAFPMYAHASTHDGVASVIDEREAGKR